MTPQTRTQRQEAAKKAAAAPKAKLRETEQRDRQGVRSPHHNVRP